MPEPRFFFDADMPAAEMLSIAGGEVAIFSARAPGKATPNEDAAVAIPVREGAAVLAVADGVGGSAAGQRASCLAAEELARSVASAPPEEAVRTAVLNGMESANRAVQQLGVGAATTMAVVEIDDRGVRPYHVGDSEILIIGQRGRIKLQTISHAPVAYAVEAGVLDESDALHHEDRHLVSNTLGDPAMRIEIGPAIELAPRDTLLVASDGLIDNLYPAEIIDTIRAGPLPRAAQRLAAAARSRMESPTVGRPSKPDDLTFVIFRRSR